jgi:hypothetical protein
MWSGNFGWKTENEGMTCLSTEGKEEIKSYYNVRTGGYSNVEKTGNKGESVVGGGEINKVPVPMDYFRLWGYHRIEFIDKGSREERIKTLETRVEERKSDFESILFSRDHDVRALLCVIPPLPPRRHYVAAPHARTDTGYPVRGQNQGGAVR